MNQFTRRQELLRRRFVRRLAVCYAVIWTALAIAPRYRQDWALENILVLIVALVMLATWQRVPLSRSGNSLLFLFLSLHAIGAHYTYSEVPYAEFLQAALGVDINAVTGWQRNHFDRAIHFAYGLLLTAPVRELCLRVAPLRTGLSYVLPVLLMASGSMVYELLEWAAALVFGGDLGVAYVGSQGDPWDAQKDMALAVSSSIVAMLTLFLVQQVRLRRSSVNDDAFGLDR